MTKNIKKIKAFAGSLTAFVLSIGIGQEACGINNQQAQTNTFTPCVLQTLNGARPIAVYDNVVNGNNNQAGAERNIMAIFNNADGVREAIEASGIQNIPMQINQINGRAFRNTLGHSITRHLFQFDGNLADNDYTPTSFFFLNGSEQHRFDNACSIINLLDPNRAEVTNSYFGQWNYNGRRYYGLIDIMVPRIEARPDRRNPQRWWYIHPNQEPVVGCAQTRAADDRVNWTQRNFASATVRYLLTGYQQRTGNIIYTWVPAASVWPNRN